METRRLFLPLPMRRRFRFRVVRATTVAQNNSAAPVPTLCVDNKRFDGSFDDAIAACRKMSPMEKIFLRCDSCGNAKIVPRDDIDPPDAVVMVTNECDVCHAAQGGFGDETWYDRKGNEVRNN